MCQSLFPMFYRMWVKIGSTEWCRSVRHWCFSSSNDDARARLHIRRLMFFGQHIYIYI